VDVAHPLSPIAFVGRDAGSMVVKDLVEVRRHHKMVVVPGAFSFTSNLCVCHASCASPLMPGTFSNDVLNPLVRGTDLERAQARAALVEILEGQVEGVLIASFLTASRRKGRRPTR